MLGLALVLALAAASVGAGCAGDEPEVRRDAVDRLVEALDLEPPPGQGAVVVDRTQSKSDYPYYTASGVLPVASREAGLDRVESALELEGFDVFERGDVDFSYGACARGRDDSMVARALVGWVEQDGFNPYPRLPGRVYVTVQVGHARSNQLWTDTERPMCGAS
jgi:hypothetical protein